MGRGQSGNADSISEAIKNVEVGRMMAALEGYKKTGRKRHPREMASRKCDLGEGCDCEGHQQTNGR